MSLCGCIIDIGEKHTVTSLLGQGTEHVYPMSVGCMQLHHYHAFGHALSMASGCGYMRDIGQYSNREKVKLVLYKYKYYCLKRGVFFMEKTRLPMR